MLNVRILLAMVAAVLSACGPWVIEQPTPAPIASTEATAAPQVALLAERLDFDPRRFVTTEDGIIYVDEFEGDLLLLLSRHGNPDVAEVLARAPRQELVDSAFVSLAVVCPRAGLEVRYYLFGQDSRDITRVMSGLEAVGGDVVDGLWVVPILDDEIEPEQEWVVRDALGLGTIESGTGAFFHPDEAPSDEHDTLCTVVH